MSNLFISDIIGTGDFAVPASDSALATATTELNALLATLGPALKYDRILAWVETRDGAGAARTLNCLLDRFSYDSGGGDEECPSETEIDSITSTIEATLEADVDITSIGQQQYHLFQMTRFFWTRDHSAGLVYPTVTTDDVGVGGGTSLDGQWFDDGDLVLGGNTMSGTERLRIIGSQRVEGGSLMTEAAAVPLTPAAGEGAFWIESTTPNIAKFTDDAGTDFTLQYLATAGRSLPGVQQVLFVDKSSSSYTADGSPQRPYNSVQAAISAAATAGASATNRYGIIIYPGIYEEAVTMSTAGVYLIGLDRETTIIQQSSGASNVLTWQVSPAGMTNLTIRVTGTATGRPFNNNVHAWSNESIWIDCDFFLASGAGTYIDFERYLILRAYNCRFISEDDSRQILSYTFSNGCDFEFHNCHTQGWAYAAGATIKFYNCSNISSAVQTFWHRGANIKGYGCYLETTDTGGTAVALYFNGSGSEWVGCTFRGGPNSDRDTNSNNYYTCYASGCRFRHGLHWGFRQVGKSVVYACGSDGDMDYYINVANAHNSLSGADGYTIYMLGDDTTSTQMNPSVLKTPVVFDGMGHTFQGTAYVALSPGTADQTIRNMRCVGEIRFLGGDWVLRLENVDLEGRIYWSGSGAGTLCAHDTRIHGTATFPIPVYMFWSATTAGQLEFDHCYIKGYTGNVAVDFQGVDYDSLYFSYTKIFHGDLGTNNPFANYDSGRVYHAHHCVMNQEPDLADPTNITNGIDSGQRYNTIDPDGDYYWLD
jgi:hypothetical protein